MKDKETPGDSLITNQSGHPIRFKRHRTTRDHWGGEDLSFTDSLLMAAATLGDWRYYYYNRR